MDFFRANPQSPVVKNQSQPKIFTQSAKNILGNIQTQDNQQLYLQETPVKNFDLQSFYSNSVQSQSSVTSSESIQPIRTKLTFLEKRRNQAQVNLEKAAVSESQVAFIQFDTPRDQDRPRLNFVYRKNSIMESTPINSSNNSSTNQLEQSKLAVPTNYKILRKSSTEKIQNCQVQTNKSILKKNTADLSPQKNVKFRETTDILNLESGIEGQAMLTDAYRVKKTKQSIVLMKVEYQNSQNDIDQNE